jgi:hypothetical protein
MASDKKTKAAPKAEPSVKKEAAVKKEASATPETKAEPKDTTAVAGADATKADGAEKATDKPSNYSRGEGQKAVTQAYKDNWNAIFAKKKK